MAAFVLVLLGAASQEEQLAWVEHADAAAMLEHDIEEGRFRFFAVCDYSCQARGVGDFNCARCYSDAATVQIIEGTSDATDSDREYELNKKAATFAAAYNQRLARHLDSSGKRSCPPGEDWDSVFSAVSVYVRGIGTQGSPMALTASYRPAPGQDDFYIRMPAPTPLTDHARRSICELVAKHGIRRRVTFSAAVGSVAEVNEVSHFSCEAGIVRFEARPTGDGGVALERK